MLRFQSSTEVSQRSPERPSRRTTSTAVKIGHAVVPPPMTAELKGLGSLMRCKDEISEAWRKLKERVNDSIFPKADSYVCRSSSSPRDNHCGTN